MNSKIFIINKIDFIFSNILNMTTITSLRKDFANKNQIRIAFNDIIYRFTPFELERMSAENFIDIFNKKYNLIFLEELVKEVIDEIFNKKKKILADYELTKKYLYNVIVKFNIFERNNCVNEYLKELNLNKDYSFDRKIVNKILEETKEDIFIEV